MRHQRPPITRSRQALVTRQRFAFAGALLVAALLPFLLRLLVLPDPAFFNTSQVSLIANVMAIVIATWIRLSVGTFPGTRSGTLIAPSIAAAHGVVLALLLMTRLPYDRLGILIGFIAHLVWVIGLHLAVHRRVRRRFAVVPGGMVDHLGAIEGVDWKRLRRPLLAETVDCDAVVADFSADLPPAWESFLADAALAGRMVYQVKQLSESLTGRVEVAHLSENSFGSLIPARGYFHLKSVIDFFAALVLVPIVIGPMLLIAAAIRLDSRGPALFRQRRLGLAGRPLTVFKFRTMRVHDAGDDERSAAMTGDGDERITRLGGFLRRSRIDELPQIINILTGEMSWIGPRPEALVLSKWYTGEIPFYRYRHVVRPGISGWAQVNQGHVANVGEVHEKLQYDFFYIKYFSPWLDLLILFRTVKTMLTGFGSR
ncbi:MAG: sugar transferase [Pseudomonadota bacterium]|nr:sugar transferase [Pseudomonadota bacterium]